MRDPSMIFQELQIGQPGRMPLSNPWIIIDQRRPSIIADIIDAIDNP